MPSCNRWPVRTAAGAEGSTHGRAGIRATRGVRHLCKLRPCDCRQGRFAQWRKRRTRMIGFSAKSCLSVSGALALLTSAALSSTANAASGYEIFVSNEHAGTVTIIEGGTFKVLDTLPVGKRPRHPRKPGRQDRLRRFEWHADRGAAAAGCSRQSDPEEE